MDPNVSANYYFNKHFKIILEITQMLYTAWWFENNPDWVQKHLTEIGAEPYRKTHYNHPTNKWIRTHPNNYLYACQMGLALCREYTRRYNRVYACQSRIEWLIQNVPICDPNQDYGTACLAIIHVPDGCTPVPLAMPVEYHTNDVLLSYRTYYINDKRHVAQSPDVYQTLCNQWNLYPHTTLPHLETSPELSKQTIAELKTHCRDNKIKGFSKCKTKKDIIHHILTFK